MFFIDVGTFSTTPSAFGIHPFINEGEVAMPPFSFTTVDTIPPPPFFVSLVQTIVSIVVKHNPPFFPFIDEGVDAEGRRGSSILPRLFCP